MVLSGGVVGYDVRCVDAVGMYPMQYFCIVCLHWHIDATCTVAKAQFESVGWLESHKWVAVASGFH